MRSVSYSFQAILKSSLLSIFCFVLQTVLGQISYGGKPLPLQAGMGARSVGPTAGLFVEMPPFDNQVALRQSLQDQTNFRSLEFAHKFHPFLRPDNSGVTFVAGNMQVWRVGIRSKGAYSLNILFSKFRLPPGAQIFVYNSDQSEILGSYNEKNNTEQHLLPIQPVGGDELIVEYQEPLDATFKGEIEIGEVNHDYLGIFRASERDPNPGNNCHANLVCYPEDIQAGSGVVGLIINGVTYCTGVLVNNTNEDGKAYLLTATHCLNDNYTLSFLINRRYDMVAGSIIAFFNYNSPLCDNNIRGPLQMSMASADSVLISEKHDISLLELKQRPPAEYQPYYLGWNINSNAHSETPFHGLHHPNGAIKKVAIDEDHLGIGSFEIDHLKNHLEYQLEPYSHWVVKGWNMGTTEGGSSGSPLLDREKRIVGTLTGGESYCSSPRGPDMYASLAKFWSVEGSIDNPNPISFYLDPKGSQVAQLGGFNPYAQQPYTKSHNFKPNEKAVKYLYQSVPLFATNNTLGYTEFAEEFYAKSSVQLRGVFLSSPSMKSFSNMNIRIRVYSGKNGPEGTPLHEQAYYYSSMQYSNPDFPLLPRDMGHSIENYIRFDKPITVSGTFYISYHDMNGIASGFSTFNAEPRKIGSGLISTAWIRNASGWIRSSEDNENPLNTALLIAPYVIGNLSTAVEPENKQPKLDVFYAREEKAIVIKSENIDLKEWEIYYSSGIKIYHETTDISINRTSYPSAHLPKGVYIVRVKTTDGTVFTKKVVVT